MKRSEAAAIKSAPGKCKLWVIETDTRDCIVAGSDRDTTTIAYVAIGAESWGPLLAAAPELLEALQELVEPAYPNGFCHRGICSEQDCGRCSRHARARAAIAKATGAQS